MSNPLLVHNKSEIIEAWQTAHEAISQLVAPLSEEQWTSRPGEKWSVAGHVEHLFLSANPVSAALKYPKEELARRFGRYEGERYSFAVLRSTYKEQLKKTPLLVNPVAPSEKAIPKEEMLRSWEMLHVKIPQRLELWTEEDLDTYCLPSPAFRAAEHSWDVVFFTIFHTDHHGEAIRQLAAVLAIPFLLS